MGYLLQKMMSWMKIAPWKIRRDAHNAANFLSIEDKATHFEYMLMCCDIVDAHHTGEGSLIVRRIGDALETK